VIKGTFRRRTLLHTLTAEIVAHFTRSRRCSDLVCFLRGFCRVDNVVGRRTLDPGRVKTPKGRFQRRIVFYRCRDFHAGLP
jgi:hypothetical protein